MQDRIPMNPGRVILTPVSGQANTYDMVRADNPTQEGTPLNKATLLSDETERKIWGEPGNRTVDAALAALGIYKQYWWRRRTTAEGWHSYVKTDGYTATPGYASGNSLKGASISYSDSLNISDTGSITLVTPATISSSETNTNKENAIKGKYFTLSKDTTHASGSASLSADKVYYASPDAYIYGYSDDDSYAPYLVNMGEVYAKYDIDKGEWEYLQSSDRNAYPDSGESGDYEYEYLGVPLDNARDGLKMQVITYVGTGVYNNSNPHNTLTFDFVPKLLYISRGTIPTSPTSYGYVDGTAEYHALIPYEYLIAVKNATSLAGARRFSVVRGTTNKVQTFALSDDNKTLSWYSTDNADSQLNASNVTYCAVAIG